jgi:hypothetical protein
MQRKNYLVNWLQIAMREVCCHLAQAFLLFNRSLRHVFSHRLHRQADKIVHANVTQLNGLGLVLLCVDD